MRLSPANQGLDVALRRFGTFIARADWTEGNLFRVLDENWELLRRHRQQVYRTETDAALVNPRTGEPITVLTDHADAVECLGLSPDSSHLVSRSHGEVFLWPWKA